MLQKVKYLFTSFCGTKPLENYLIHNVAAWIRTLYGKRFVSQTILQN